MMEKPTMRFENLGDREIEILSAWYDGEATRQEMRQAEELLARSPEAREFIEQTAAIGSMTRLSSADHLERFAPARPPRTAELVARDRRFRLLGRSLPLLLLLLGSTTLFVALADPFGGGEAESGERIAAAESIAVASEVDLGLFSSISEPIVRASVLSIHTAGSTDDSAPKRTSPIVAAVRDDRSRHSTNEDSGPALDPPATTRPDHELVGTASFSIILNHNDATIVIGDDSDTIRVEAEDQALLIGHRLSELTDSLNAAVWRIASDTSRSRRNRVEAILQRHREYDRLLEIELRRLSGDTTTPERPMPEGADAGEPGEAASSTS